MKSTETRDEWYSTQLCEKIPAWEPCEMYMAVLALNGESANASNDRIEWTRNYTLWNFYDILLMPN